MKKSDTAECIYLDKATKAEVADIVALQSESADYHRAINKNWLSGKESTPAFKKYLTQVINKKNYLWLVAKCEDKTIGYFCATIVKVYGKVEKKIGHLEDAYIIPDYRRLGIMQTVIGIFTTWLKSQKVKLMELSVDNHNELGLKSWKAMGFKPESLKLQKTI